MPPRSSAPSSARPIGATQEQLFVELADLLETDPGNVDAVNALGAKYGLDSDPEATARLVAEHGLIEST